jgi:cardiolipin synthase
VSVGSTNFDMRSFQLNDEASLNVYDSQFAQQMTTVFEQDARLGAPYTLERWKQRPWTERLAEVIVFPIRSQL